MQNLGRCTEETREETIIGAPEKPAAKARRQIGMGRLIKVVLVLAVVAFAGLTGFAYVADLAPAPMEVKLPVTLNAD